MVIDHCLNCAPMDWSITLLWNQCKCHTFEGVVNTIVMCTKPHNTCDMTWNTWHVYTCGVDIVMDGIPPTSLPICSQVHTIPIGIISIIGTKHHTIVESHPILCCRVTIITSHTQFIVTRLRTHTKLIIPSPECLPIPVSHINPQSISSGGGQCVETIQTNPVVRIRRSKSIPVVNPGFGEVDGGILAM